MANEADTCRTYILPRLHAAGWEDDSISEQFVLTPGRIVPLGERRHFRKDGLRADNPGVAHEFLAFDSQVVWDRLLTHLQQKKSECR